MTTIGCILEKQYEKMISFAPLRHSCESRNLVFLGFLFLLLSCSKNKQETSSILPKSLMAEVLAEMELAQAAYKFQAIDKRFDIDFMFDEIYKKNKINKEEFNTSLKFYSSSPKEMDDIYNETIVLLTHKQAEYLGK